MVHTAVPQRSVINLRNRKTGSLWAHRFTGVHQLADANNLCTTNVLWMSPGVFFSTTIVAVLCHCFCSLIDHQTCFLQVLVWSVGIFQIGAVTLWSLSLWRSTKPTTFILAYRGLSVTNGLAPVHSEECVLNFPTCHHVIRFYVFSSCFTGKSETCGLAYILRPPESVLWVVRLRLSCPI